MAPPSITELRLKIGHAWALLRGSGGPQTKPILPKPDLAGEYRDTWLSLLESHAWRCWTFVHACSKRVGQIGGFILFNVLCVAQFIIFLQLKYW